jgi:hypothetical protein
MKDIMVDIETLGRRAGCIILSVGAIMFNPKTGEMGNEFYVNIDPEIMREMGAFHTDPSTVKWWKEQSKEAQDALKMDRVKPLDGLLDFVKFFQKNKCEKFWCQGVSFDPPIIEYALNVYGLTVPWKFWNTRDTRTVYDICNFDPKSIRRDGVYHTAVDDCRHQIRCVKEALNVRS